MNEFVNYKKRDITLPKGCKDLHDVLAQQELEKLPPTEVSAQHCEGLREKSETRTLSEIGKYMASAFACRGPHYLVVTHPHDKEHTLSVSWDGATLSVWATVPENSSQANFMQNFFVRQGLDKPKHDGLPATFNPSLPVQLIFDISPLPPPGPLLSELIMSLFREVWEVKEDANLDCCFIED